MIHDLKPYPAYKDSDVSPASMVFNGFIELKIRKGEK